MSPCHHRLPALAVLLLAVVFCWGKNPCSGAGTEGVPVAEEYLLRVWEVDEGLPHNAVLGIAQTPDGYLWIATSGGLARFDGVRFTAFLKDVTPGLESNYVRTVFASREGDLWVGLERGGVARRRNNCWETIVSLPPRTVTTSWTSSFAQDGTGAVWFGRAPDLTAFRWHEGKLDTFSAQDGVGPGTDTFVHADTNGAVWFATKAACGKFDNGRFLTVDAQGGAGVRLAVARSGGMWATRGQQLLYYSPDGTQTAVADLAWMGGAVEVSTLLEDSAGDLWLGTRSAGLFRFRNGKFAKVATSHGAVQAIMEDREGNLWVGTRAGGLNRLRQSRFSQRQTRHGLSRDSTVSLCEDTDGKLWLAMQDGDPVRAIDDANRSFATPPGWPGAPVTVICSDPAGGVWIGTNGSGLIRWRDGVFHREPLSERVRSLLVDRQGNLWITTANAGLIRRREGIFHPVPTEGGLIAARALAEDGAGCIWCGTEEGIVFRQQRNQFHRVPLPGAKAGESIQFIAPDGADTVWIGAMDGGIYRWKAGEIARLPHGVGMPTHDLRSMVTEPGGRNIWISTGRGLYRVARSKLEAVLDGKQPSLDAAVFGRNEGVRSMDFVFGNRNSTVITRDGHLWFATSRGALEIGPGSVPKNAPPLPVLIEEMVVGGAPLSLEDQGSLILPPNPGLLEIRYTLPHGGAPEQLRFRYHLEGLNDGWISAGDQRTATFPHLPPGNYRFSVEAAAADGPWLPGAASLAFSVRASWWETMLFRVGAMIVCLSGLGWLLRWILLRRMRARLLRLKQERALERERARIARDMHDELGASLTRIALMSDLAAFEPEMSDSAMERFGEISQAARSVSGTLDQIVWTVNPRNDTLERLVGYIGEFAAEYLETAGIKLRLELPPDLPALVVASDVRHQILLAVKEALNNVAKYAGASAVTVRATFERGELCLTIVDDGRGFDPTEVPGSANGLGNMRQRLEGLGGSAHIESRPDKGTSVTFNLPLDGAAL